MPKLVCVAFCDQSEWHGEQQVEAGNPLGGEGLSSQLLGCKGLRVKRETRNRKEGGLGILQNDVGAKQPGIGRARNKEA